MGPVTKAVLPVAGLGTRFLPATKASPKEMLPLVDKPLIQYAVEEAIAAGITELIFITNGSKRAIEEHFSHNEELEAYLLRNHKNKQLAEVKNITPAHIKYTYIKQSKPLGLGHAVLCAKEIVGNQPFAVLLADDFIHSPQKSALQELLECYQQTRTSVVAIEEVDHEDVEKYGIVSIGEDCSEYLIKINDIVEKPKKGAAPSLLGVVGRYVLTPKIFEYLEQCHFDGSELQLTDGIQQLLQEEDVYALKFSGERYDCGSKLGYLKAIIKLAIQHPDLKQDLSSYLKNLNF